MIFVQNFPAGMSSHFDPGHVPGMFERWTEAARKVEGSYPSMAALPAPEMTTGSVPATPAPAEDGLRRFVQSVQTTSLASGLAAVPI